MQIKSKRFYNIKRYENYLKQSMDSSILSQIEQLTPYLIQNKVSYQFKHFQLRSKSSNSKNLVKKTSLSHLVSADSSQLSPELKFQKYNIGLKKQNESFKGSLCCLKKGKNNSYMSSASFIKQKNNQIRPKSVTSAVNGRRIHRGMNVGRDLNGVKQADFELAPW